jgi:general secretion pathway protein F
VKTYEYRGYDREGRTRAGLVEALGPKEARERLAAAGVLVERVAPVGRGGRLSSDRRAVLYRELAALLRAGMTLVKSLDVLIGSAAMSHAAPVLAAVRDRVREGGGLAASLEAACGSISAFERAVIEAAEHAATVPDMLAHLATTLEQQERIKHRVRTALIYPTLVVIVGVIVGGLMLGLLVPRAQDILAYTRGTLPGITRFAMGFARVALRWGLPLAMIPLGALALHVRRLRRDAEYRERWDRRSFRWPLWGPGYALLVNLRFARTLSLLLRSGLPLIEGARLAGRATGSPWIRRLAEEAAESVRHGTALSLAIRGIPPLAETLSGWLQVGEATGDMVNLLDSAATRLEDRWDRYSSRALAFLEPVLILAIGGFVLLIALSVLLPVINLTQGLSR